MTKGSKKYRRKGENNNHTHKGIVSHKHNGNKKHSHKINNKRYDINFVVGDHNSVDNKHIVSKIGGMFKKPQDFLSIPPQTPPREPEPEPIERTLTLHDNNKKLNYTTDYRNIVNSEINSENFVLGNPKTVNFNAKREGERKMDIEEERDSFSSPTQDTSPIKILTNVELNELNEANLIVYQNEMHNFENLFFKNDLLFTNLLFENDENDENDKTMNFFGGGNGETPDFENIYTFMCYIYDRIHDFINGPRTKTIGDFISFTKNEIKLFERYGRLLQENDNTYNIFNSIRLLLDDYKSSANSQKEKEEEEEEEPQFKKPRVNEETDVNEMDIDESAFEADNILNDDHLKKEISNFKEKFVKLASIMIKNQIPILKNRKEEQQGLNESNLVLDILDTKFYSFDCINSCKQEFILRYESDTIDETEQNEIKEIINKLIDEFKEENIIYIKEEDKKNKNLKRYVVYIFPKNKYIPPEFFNESSYYVTDVNIRASQQYYL